MEDVLRINDFQGRPYQRPLWDYMMAGGKRAVAVWHRRAGKDVTALDITRRLAFKRIGNYYHCFPEYTQGRKVLWDGIDKNGTRFIERMTKLASRVNEQEMKIQLLNGAIWQIIGADNYDSLVGGNPVGIVFSEWAISDKYPAAWDYFRPMLVENGGWAIFIYTPRGRNHGFDLYAMAAHNDEWFCELLTADHTGVISNEDIEAERRSGMSEDIIRQEFYCDFLASTENVLIPYDLLDGAKTRMVDYPAGKTLAGLDVARFGDDRTALVCRRGGMITNIETWQGLNAIQVAGKVKEAYSARQFDAIAVDAIGVGAGVADLIQAQGVPCIAVNVAETSSYKDRFHRLRDELWWQAREWFFDKKCTIRAASATEKLISELAAVTYDYRPNGTIQIEPKQAMKDRLGYSPDIADAFCLTFTPGLDRIRAIGIATQTHADMTYNPFGGAL